MIRAVAAGLRDGWSLGNPHHDLSSGMTFRNDKLNELYDSAVNLGASIKQFIGAIL